MKLSLKNFGIIAFFALIATWYGHTQTQTEIINNQGTTSQGIIEGFNPVQYLGGSGVVRGWYRGDLGITLDTSGTPSIQRWADQSGNGNDLTQSTKASQPVQIAGPGGKPVVDFSNGNTFLGTDGSLSPSLMFVSGSTGPFTFFSVAKQITQNSSATYFSYGNSTNITPRLGWKINTGVANAFNLRRDADDASNISYNPSFVGRNSNAWETMVWRWDGTSHKFIDSYSSAASGSQAADYAKSSTLDTFSLGAFYRNGAAVFFSQSQVAEVIITTNTVPDDQVRGILSYFKQRYNR